MTILAIQSKFLSHTPLAFESTVMNAVTMADVRGSCKRMRPQAATVWPGGAFSHDRNFSVEVMV